MDFQLVPEIQLNVNPESKYFNVSVETCAQICTLAEAFLCLSFDFFTDTNACFLYKVNLKDKLSPNVFGVENLACQHYTSKILSTN